MNKMVGLLSMVAMVGVLGVAMFFISSGKGNVALESQAAPLVSETGTLWAPSKDACLKNYYIGCYKLIKANGTKLDLFESTRSVNLNNHVGLKVTVNGKMVRAGKRMVFMVASIN